VLRTKIPAAKRVSFFAARDIAVDEELLYDYGGKYWSGREGQELP
jgi:SET domain-containing protein